MAGLCEGGDEPPGSLKTTVLHCFGHRKMKHDTLEQTCKGSVSGNKSMHDLPQRAVSRPAPQSNSAESAGLRPCTAHAAGFLVKLFRR
ncbi:hypothetical protein ANN_16511 [Periplaneta americana]|uniref:Uncharacterized protein n=1 Tax=Periplaneta americana TaxID=6978 RepID=A0ABQ8SQM1_PERAM|nr:hypothetical protein ANN_16511 [Periplaneta americana]